MSGWKKLASAAAASGAALNVENVFSTYLYKGNQTARTITNGIDLAGEGGLTWITPRTTNAEMQFIDSERGVSASSTPVLISSMSNGSINRTGAVTAYNSDGFDLGTYDATNYSGRDMVSWTFRKAPKFFDVVTYTGNGTAGRTVSHNLGSVPGCIIVKRTDTSGDWAVFHRSLNGGSNPAVKHLELNGTGGEGTNTGYWNDTDPTSTVFSVGINSRTNANGGSYVAYLFAHNDGDGDFGPTGDQDIIKCGVYSGNGTNDGPAIDLGFEPQWFMVRNITEGGDWIIVDNMRSGKAYMAGNLTDNSYLRANSVGAELVNQADAGFTSIGFTVSGGTFSNASAGVGNKYIYIAIRRGPMGLPESGDDVFETAFRDGTEPAFDTNWPVDAAIYHNNITTAHSKFFGARLRGYWITQTTSTAAEQDLTAFEWDYNDGYYSSTGASTNVISHMWRRTPQCFDVVSYKGNGTDGRTVTHNLGIAPEMMWVKSVSHSYDWIVYHKDLGNATYSAEESWLKLNSLNLQDHDTTAYWNGTAPTSSVFSLNSNTVNQNGGSFIAFLFGSLDGVSKVGSYTGDGTTNGSKLIDCGFSNGPKLVIIKIYEGEDANNWFIFDTARGINAGSEPRLFLNNTLAQGAPEDYIDPHSSGFYVGTASNTRNSTNVLGSKYIFYAVAA